jgi:hypothetical protein
VLFGIEVAISWNELSLADLQVSFTARAEPLPLLGFSLAISPQADVKEAGYRRHCARLFEELARLDLDRFCKPAQRRDLGVPLPGLHPADLSDMDPAALRNLFLGEPQVFSRLPQSGAEVGHGGDRLRLRQKAP